MAIFKAIIVAVSICATATHAQDSINVPIDQAAQIATQALFAGETQFAFQIAAAVLQQRPDDRAALMVVAAAAPQLGDPTTGRQAGARAWAVSQTDLQKYEAARLTALAAANEERFTLSTFWLRRALTVVPNDAERERTLQDARAVTRRNPWSTQLSFSLAPSNNVNGGAEDAISTAPGNPTGTLSEDALALAGWRASLGFGAQYRLQETTRSRTIAGLQYQVSRVRITEDTNVPDEAFDSSSTEFSLRHDRVLENGTLSARLSRGRFDYRDLDLADESTEFQKYDVWRFGLDRRLPLSDRTVLSLSASREGLEYQAATIGTVDRIIVGAGLSYRLESGDQVNVAVSFADSQGDSVNYTSQEQTLRAEYSWAEPIGPITLSVGGGIKWSDYPDYRLLFAVSGGRQDTTGFASMNIGFPQVEYAGFTPGLRIDASQSDSNVSRFDRTSFSVGLTINSSF